MVRGLIKSKVIKSHLLQSHYLHDFLLKFMPSELCHILKNTGFRANSLVSVCNVNFKNRARLLRLNRIFESLRFFNIRINTNYTFNHRYKNKSKLFFSVNFPFLSGIIDFYNFFLIKLAARSRILTRNFIYRDFLQINFYDFLQIGLFDKQIDYYGWQDPLIIRIQLNQLTARKKIDFEQFLLNHKNYFIFFILKLQLSRFSPDSAEF